MDTLGEFPGLPGLLVAGLYSASLRFNLRLFKNKKTWPIFFIINSTVSSGLNSLAAVTLEDFLRPIFPNMSETRATNVSKCLSFSYGLISFAIVFLLANVSHVGEV